MMRDMDGRLRCCCGCSRSVSQRGRQQTGVLENASSSKFCSPVCLVQGNDFHPVVARLTTIAKDLILKETHYR